MNGWERFQKRRSGNTENGQNTSSGWARFQESRAATGNTAGSGWERFLQQSRGVQRASSDSDIYGKSGMDALRKDADALTGGLTQYFQNEHTANAGNSLYRQKTRLMLDAIANEREYFRYYADAFTPEDLTRYNNELDTYEAQLKRYNGAFGDASGKASDKDAAIMGSGYSALSNGLTSFDNDIRGLAQSKTIVTGESTKDLQQRRTALSSKLEAAKRYMEQNAALFTPQERKQWQAEFDRYESYLNGVGVYLDSVGVKNPWTGKLVPMPSETIPTPDEAKRQSDIRQKVTGVLGNLSKAVERGITPENAQQEQESARGAVARARWEAGDLGREYAELSRKLASLPDNATTERSAIGRRLHALEGEKASREKTISEYSERAKVAEAAANAGEGYRNFRLASMVQQALTAPDFQEKSKPEDGVFSYTVDDTANWRLALSDDYDYADAIHIKNPEYGYINGTDEDRTVIINQYAVHNAERDSFASYDYLTEQEKGVFNYLWATDGAETAMEYLNALKPTLDYRHGTTDAEYAAGTFTGNVVIPAVRGFQNTMRNTEALLGGGQELPISPIEYETAARQENAGKAGKWVIGASTSFGQMIPALVASGATQNSWVVPE